VTQTATTFVGDLDKVSPRVDIRERISPEYHRKEVNRVFRRGWLLVAPVSDLPRPNTYVAIEVPPLRACIVVTRAADGEIRAFHNTCRHRGNRLVDPGKGEARAFVCGFHGWSFHNDGRVGAIPDRSQFTDIDEDELGLIPVHCAVWEGFVFVNFAETPEESLEEWLGVMHGQFTGYFDDREKIASYRIVIEANWNVAINAFSEGYHALFVHRHTVPDYQGGSQNPDRYRPYMEVTNHHGRYTAEGNPKRKPPPAEALAYGRGRPLYPSFPPYSPEAVSLPPGVNPARVRDFLSDAVEIFPHVTLLNGAYWTCVLSFWPIDEWHTDIQVMLFAYKARTVGDHMAHAYYRARLREVLREDIGIMEQVTAQLRAGAMRDIVLSQQELLVQKHYAAIAEMVAQP
jgi:Rieske 2Fe-2S family protein